MSLRAKEMAELNTRLKRILGYQKLFCKAPDIINLLWLSRTKP
jgi:hypothetical protein